MLTFDPDGDDVRCRFASSALSECTDCTTPSVLSISSSSCTLLFSSSASSSQGSYVVQMVMEDFPLQTITLTQTGGSQVQKTTSDAISKIPIQFILKVDAAAPSCTEGQYLPRFLSPTPNNRAQLYTSVNQTLVITIRAEAAQATLTELLYSGPYNVNKSSLGSGSFSLMWTPSAAEGGESHPICFVIQATYTYYNQIPNCNYPIPNYQIPNYNNQIPNYNNPIPNYKNPIPNDNNPIPKDHNPIPKGHNPITNDYKPFPNYNPTPNYYNPTPNYYNPTPNYNNPTTTTQPPTTTTQPPTTTTQPPTTTT
ncbi:uncharacterized protein LOC103481206 [Poecilia reticulata]|uniref:uncharacterized protein LOC103481206 n=1 Tax=Poecilia reticulata TaxID=8081 RepID=UPI0007E9F146|nr:PREDICTED: uncharacterized protein LOC103481206 [Poecilia reticulata]